MQRIMLKSKLHRATVTGATARLVPRKDDAGQAKLKVVH